MGFFSSSSKRTTNNETKNFSNQFGIGGDNTGLAVSGDNNQITVLDGGAIDSAHQLAEIALNGVGDAMEINKSIAETSILMAGDSNQTIANLSNDFGNNLTYLADSSISGNQFLTETALNNNAMLISDFGSDLLTMSDKNAELALISMDNNSLLASEFGSNLSSAYSGYSNNIADLTQLSLNNNTDLANEFGNKMTDVITTQQLALTDMAVLQERGLDNALQVAGSMATNDNSEASTAMVKYIMMGLAVIGGAMVFKS